MRYYYVLQIGGAIGGAYFRTLSERMDSREVAERYREALDQSVSDYIAVITTSDPELNQQSFEAS